ncbi:MAG: DUF1156 domain-containing protein, partial [Candidatus Bipolaricaulota bacterium]|nr:DUF1156 domain-containing protein [Candidatus Bipolaricaulota bacterium]
MDRRLIEVAFPILEVSQESKREKNIRHGHISTLHIWWARRPLAASRTTALAALLPDPGDEEKRRALLDFLKQIAPWDVVAGKDPAGEALIAKARELIRQNFPHDPPKVLDCFAGGGSIPLEALRLGCETYALDYNPVAVLLLKCVLEYPQKFRDYSGPLPLPPATTKASQKEASALWKEGWAEKAPKANPLLWAVKAWGEWVLEEARKELAPFYPPDSDGAIPVGY